MTLPVPGDVAPGPVPSSTDSLETMFRAVWSRMSEDQRKTLYSVVISGGGITIQGDGAVRILLDDGTSIFYTGPMTSGGTPYQGIIMRRADGSRIFSTFPVGGDPNVIAWSWYDQAGREVLSSDAQSGGLARPWIPVVLTAKMSMAAGTFDYYNLPVTGTERQLWEGRIPFVSHPRIEVDGLWGQASGSNSTTYRLKISGTLVGDWTVSGGLSSSRRGPYDITPWLHSTWVPVEITAQSSGTGVMACHVVGCTMRQS